MKKSKYENLVNQSDNKLTLVDFYADWCGPCQAMMPSIQKVAKAYSKEMSVFKINIDKNAGLATNLNIRSVPTLLLYRNGKVIWKQSGGMSFHQLKSELKHFMNK